MGEGGARASAHAPILQFRSVPIDRAGLRPGLRPTHLVTLEPKEGCNGEDRGLGDGRKTAKQSRNGHGVLLPRENQELSLRLVLRTRTSMITP